MRLKILLMMAILCLPLAAFAAAEFDTSGKDDAGAKAEVTEDKSSESGGAAKAPQLLDAGDIPTAYAPLKYEARVDVRFYDGGGILTKAYLGVFSRFAIGGGLNVPSLIGSGDIDLRREDAQLLLKLLAFKEDERFPAIALGWDGPAYSGGPLRGLYVVVSKDIQADPGSFQVHGGLNTPVFDGFSGSRDLRGFAAVTTTYQQVTVFFEGEDFFDPIGVRLNIGGRVYFDPISLGVEFHDLGGIRVGTKASRLLRVSYTGLF